ncbi:MAG: hypothetical protein C0593_11570 [Marinilabiliales bacterium]|nr:MAG: hypothetical protein C0593_11570 [Marinilabiliales bacterium]
MMAGTLNKYISILLFLIFVHCASVTAQNNFSFAFFADIHFDGSASQSRKLAHFIEKADAMNCELIITGGDNIVVENCINQIGSASQCYKTLDSLFKTATAKVFPLIGNHDRNLETDTASEYYNTGLFSEFSGTKDYYSFNHKGWHFIMLNNVCFKENPGKYSISDEQLSWLQQDLTSISPITPIFLIVHVPLVSVLKPFIRNKNRERQIRKPFREMMTLFDGYNLKMVLQGHHHIYKISCLNEIPYITGGAIHPALWSFLFNTKPGFVNLTVQQETITYQYITEND